MKIYRVSKNTEAGYVDTFFWYSDEKEAKEKQDFFNMMYQTSYKVVTFDLNNANEKSVIAFLNKFCGFTQYGRYIYSEINNQK